jgi:hypothetical protein
MKKIYLSLGIVATLGLGIFQTSCKKSPLDNLEVAVNTDVLSTPTAILFENAIVDSDTQPLDFTVKVSGKDADKVLSAIGNKTFEVQNGFLILNLAKGTNPTPENPIQFILTGTEENFEPLYKEITITSNEEQKFNVKMIETGKLPEGIAETKTTANLTNGEFASTFTFETTTTNGSAQATSFEIAPGTTMIDTEGKPIVGSSLDIKARYFDPSSDALEVFPGGLNPQNVKDEKGNDIEGGVQFYSSGLMHIEMKAGDKIVKNFSKPVSAEMELKVGQENPLTGEIIVAGDSIPLWSRDDISGDWKNEGYAKVVSKNGKLVAEFEMQHLSSWNLDHFETTQSFSKISNVLNINLKTAWTNPSGNFEVIMLTPNNMVLSRKNLGSTYDGMTATLYQVPNTPKIKLKIINKANNKELTTNEFDPRNTKELEVRIGSLILDNSVDITLKYNVKCTSNKKFSPRSNAYLIVRDLTTRKRYVFRTGTGRQALQGTLDMTLVNGNKYLVQAIGLDGKIISYEAVLDINKLTYDKAKLKGFTVDKLEYNSTTKKIEVEVTYTSSKC